MMTGFEPAPSGTMPALCPLSYITCTPPQCAVTGASKTTGPDGIQEPVIADTKRLTMLLLANGRLHPFTEIPCIQIRRAIDHPGIESHSKNAYRNGAKTKKPPVVSHRGLLSPGTDQGPRRLIISDLGLERANTRKQTDYGAKGHWLFATLVS